MTDTLIENDSAAPAEPLDQIIDVDVSAVMRQSYLDYAVSVIVGRALPDVRDGLKPVHRRVLWAMSDLGMAPNTPFKKSARIVGECIGKYHPHGDTAAYDSMVRMIQPFSLLHPLVDGHGNFGSVDGDSPAAMRYTEARLSRVGHSFFADIDNNTVDFLSNYDGSEKEPSVLPAPYPNLLVNGVEGIAVGMATSIPPHNLREVVLATLAVIDKGDQVTTEDILAVMPGPDFPTGGTVMDLDGYRSAVETGRGRVRLRSKWTQETPKRGNEMIVINEIPYQVNKAKLIEDIAERIKDKSITDISHLRDESDKDGVRMVIEMRKDSSPQVLFSHLAKTTEVEISFSYNIMVLDGGRPVQMGVVDVLRRFITFRSEVIARRIRNELEKIEQKLITLAGLVKALDRIDNVVSLIRKSEGSAAANAALCTLLSITPAQAQAVLDLRLHRLTSMEASEIRTEMAVATARSIECRDILAKPERVVEILREELIEYAKKYGKDRASDISFESSHISMFDLVPNEPCLIHMTHEGYVKRMASSGLEVQNRYTKGKAGIQLGDEDYVESTHSGTTHDMFLLFTASGRCLARRVWQLPEGGTQSRGRHLRNLFEELDEGVEHILFVPSLEDQDSYIVSVSQLGKVRRTSIGEYSSAIRRNGIQGSVLEEGDSLFSVLPCRTGDHMMLVSSRGKAIRFEISDGEVRPMGRTATGARGMRLADGEKIVGAIIIPCGVDAGGSLFCAGRNGVGKRTLLNEFTLQSRGGTGVFCFNINTKTGDIAKALLVHEENDIILSTRDKSVRINAGDVRLAGRVTAGTHLMDVRGVDDGIVDVLCVPGLVSEPEVGGEPGIDTLPAQ